jgi:hypothetical protein
MVPIAIGWAGTFLIALVLLRGIVTKLAFRYVFFYTFVVATVFGNFGLLWVYSEAPALYRTFYWAAELVSVVLTYGIVLEIFRFVLAPFPGPKRLARAVAIIALVVLFVSSGLFPLFARFALKGTLEDLERNMRCVEAVFCAVILVLIWYYRIPLGRNMKGMVAGYVLSVGATLGSMAADSYTGGRFAYALGIATQLGYAIPFGIWVIALWSCHPNPVSVHSVRIEQDYDRAVARMYSALGALRGHIGKGIS